MVSVSKQIDAKTMKRACTFAKRQIGERIRETRMAKGITIEELADRAHVSVSMVKRSEQGEFDSYDKVFQIAYALDISLATSMDRALVSKEINAQVSMAMVALGKIQELM